MSNQQPLDDKLAEITDMILEGKAPPNITSVEQEVRVVQLLQQTIRPDDEVDTKFRQRLTGILSEEYDQQQRRARKRSRGIINLRSTRGLAAAAAAMVVIAGVALVLLGENTTQDSLPGTVGVAEDPANLVLFLGFIGILSVVGFLVWRKRR